MTATVSNTSLHKIVIPQFLENVYYILYLLLWLFEGAHVTD